MTAASSRVHRGGERVLFVRAVEDDVADAVAVLDGDAERDHPAHSV
jgi:hypothetical protein